VRAPAKIQARNRSADGAKSNACVLTAPALFEFRVCCNMMLKEKHARTRG
jgi:hypothetical protein